MSPSRGSLALVAPAPSNLDRGSERRAHARLTPRELSARLKYGERVTLVDVSVGGALLETSRVLRPDTDLVLEFLDSRSRQVAQVVSRVLRAQVAEIEGGIRYRGACVFRRPLAHPSLTAAPAGPGAQPLLQTDAHDFLRLEFALKAIVEEFMKRRDASGRASDAPDAAALISALARVRVAAERRDDGPSHQIAELLDVVVPALTRSDPRDAIVAAMQQHLSRSLPLLGLQASSGPAAPAPDRELVTLSVAAAAESPRLAVTAEFPVGFAPDARQFRLLKAATYLVGLVGQWQPSEPEQPRESMIARPRPVDVAASTADTVREHDEGELPVGWQRIVVRYLDGRLLRGYSNDFHPARAHLHVCPQVNCAANERLLVPLSRLKAVFFVKTLYGDPKRVDDPTFDFMPGGRRVEVTFRDGEVILGSTMSYKPNEQGFLVHPANSRGNNIRVYVVTAAIRHMRFV